MRRGVLDIRQVPLSAMARSVWLGGGLGRQSLHGHCARATAAVCDEPCDAAHAASLPSVWHH